MPPDRRDQRRHFTAEQAINRLVFTQPLQRPGIMRQLPPVTGQERHQPSSQSSFTVPALRVAYLQFTIHNPGHGKQVSAYGVQGAERPGENFVLYAVDEGKYAETCARVGLSGGER